MPTLSVIIITKNEAHRIRRCLESVRWANEVVVVDSASTDKTREICQEFTHRILVRVFDTFSAQKNAALDQATGEWILSLDADEVVSRELAQEIRETMSNPPSPSMGYRVQRHNHLCGHPIRHVWGDDCPVRLFRRDKGRFVKSVHEEVRIEGSVGRLMHVLLHYNSDSLAEYIAKNALYTTFEARQKYGHGERFSLLKLLLSPIHVFFFRFVTLRGYRDGMMGCILSLLLAYFVFCIHLKIGQIAMQSREQDAREDD